MIEAYLTHYPDKFQVIAHCLANFVKHAYDNHLPFSNFNGKDLMEEMMILLENAVLDEYVEWTV